MLKTTLTRAALIAIAAVCLLAAANSAVGSWDCAAINPDGEALKFTLKVQEEQGQISGAIVTPDGETKLSSMKYENSTLTFKVDYQGAPYTLELKITGDKLAGTYRGDSASGEVKGSRSK